MCGSATSIERGLRLFNRVKAAGTVGLSRRALQKGVSKEYRADWFDADFAYLVENNLIQAQEAGRSTVYIVGN